MLGRMLSKRDGTQWRWAGACPAERDRTEK